MKSKGYWVETQIIFSGKDAAPFYNLIKTQKFDWKILTMDQHTFSLGEIDLCFSRPNARQANHWMHFEYDFVNIFKIIRILVTWSWKILLREKSKKSTKGISCVIIRFTRKAKACFLNLNLNIAKLTLV